MAAKNNNTVWMVLLGVLLVGGVVAAVMFGSKTATGKNPLDILKPGGGGNNGGNDTPAGNLDYDLVLKYGSRGPEVEELQRRLNAKGANLNVDGIFGPLTEAALKKVNLGFGQITLSGFTMKIY